MRVAILCTISRVDLEMNRAFVKELDGDDVIDDIPERTHSDLPNYITPAGLIALKKSITDLKHALARLDPTQSIDAKSRKQSFERDLRFVRERAARAILVEPPEAESDVVRFGMTVTLQDGDDREYTFTIVGEDETDIEKGRISWASPLAKLLINKQIGDEVPWPRGDDVLDVEITKLSV